LLTALWVEDFEHLLGFFSPCGDLIIAIMNLKASDELFVNLNPPLSISRLPNDADKLFFTVCYLKNNALQTFNGFAFGLSQGRTGQWASLLLTLLEKSLQQTHQFRW
jgi:hypothetical protein